MHKFKTGDIVVALSSRHCNMNPREEGKEYRVHGVMKCPSCMEEFVCINDTHYDQTIRIKCSACGCSDMHSNHVWTLASNFKIKGLDLKLELNLAVKMEDYARAAQLRDMIRAEEA